MTHFALRTAMTDMTHWAKEGVAMRVAVNVSALDVATEDFAEEVGRLARRGGSAGVAAGAGSHRERADPLAGRSDQDADELRERGIRLSVDDYGTGQSTLSYLKHLPVHELKIDKSFVTTLTNSESDAIMVRSTINLAHDLGCRSWPRASRIRQRLTCCASRAATMRRAISSASRSVRMSFSSWSRKRAMPAEWRRCW